MFIRQLDYVVTLAGREKHFGRAAEACYVSQPALSAAIRHLEEELGVSIVQRGQRFQGFSPEGEHILDWARQTLAAWEELRQEASTARTRLTGTLRLGAIPTTMPIVSLLTGPYRAAHSEIRQRVQSLSSEEIIRRLDDFELDIGLAYLEDQRLKGFRVLPLYHERYMLLARDTASIIVPHSLLCLFEMREELAAIPLTPELNRAIGLIALDHDPLSPMVAAAWAVTQTLDLEARFNTVISGAHQPIRTNE